MSNPNTNTTPKPSNQDVINIKVDQLQRNQEDCQQTLEVFLSCVRNPRQHLGQRVVLKKSKHFATDMQTLEKIGYVRNPEQQCFELPQKPEPCPFKDDELKPVISIADKDKKFIQKMEWLEQNGYVRNPEKNCWEKQSDTDTVALPMFSSLLKASVKTTTAGLVLLAGAGSVLLNAL